MSDTEKSFSTPEPSKPDVHVEKDGYSASFYGGFVRQLTVRKGTTETVLYRQEGIFYLPPGWDKPWPSSTLHFTRPDGARISLQIENPGEQIGRIEIHLKDKSTPPLAAVRESGMSTLGEDPPPPEDGDDTVLIVEDGPVLCPPMCPQGPA